VNVLDKQAEQTKSPNVIVFFTDQQRWDTTGVHGNPLELTPNFDRMARKGTHLSQTFTCQPVCGSARACLQTGKYATTTGCFRNGVPLPENERTLANHFNDAGYETGYIGKWHLAKKDPVPKEERGGYKYWMGANSLEHTSDAYDTVVYDNENRERKLPGYRVDALTNAAIEYIDEHKDDPFSVYLLFGTASSKSFGQLPSTGWIRRVLPRTLVTFGSYSVGWHLCVKRLDEALGRLMDTLKSLDLSEDTIIFFTSDHGCHFKTRNKEYKRSGHESSIRIPGAMYGGPLPMGDR
jgi:arylsulfatase A-like enzyme